mgnify:CR=1 FL=1
MAKDGIFDVIYEDSCLPSLASKTSEASVRANKEELSSKQVSSSGDNNVVGVDGADGSAGSSSNVVLNDASTSSMSTSQSVSQGLNLEGSVTNSASKSAEPVTAPASAAASGQQQSQQVPYKRPYQYTKLWLRNPGPNPKWIYIRCDNDYSMFRPFHIEISWISCDSWLLDDWISVLFRRCSSYNLRIVQLPEFFFSGNVQLHSFRAQPYIRVPTSYVVGSNKNTLDNYKEEDIPTPHCGSPEPVVGSINSSVANSIGSNEQYNISAVLIVERIYLRQQLTDWIEDDEQVTDWNSVGVPIPCTHYHQHHRDNLTLNPCATFEPNNEVFSLAPKPVNANPGAGAVTSALTESLSRQSELTNQNPSLQNTMVKSQTFKELRGEHSHRPVKKETDRQYILRLGNGGVRVGNGGFIWLLNMAVNVNELKTDDASASTTKISTDEKKEMGLAKLHEFSILCIDVGICVDILNEIVDITFNTIAAKHQKVKD